jgi:sporulation protein YabP
MRRYCDDTANGRKDKLHTLSLTARSRVEITGVCEVESFDTQYVVLITDCGELTLEGEELHVGTLDISRGVVHVQGQIIALLYSDGTRAARKGRRRRLG